MSLRQTILDSRLGLCWKCMSLSGALLLVSAFGLLVSLQLNSLEGNTLLGSTVINVVMLVAVCAFALLALAHLVALVLRFTVWSDARSNAR